MRLLFPVSVTLRSPSQTLLGDTVADFLSVVAIQLHLWCVIVHLTIYHFTVNCVKLLFLSRQGRYVYLTVVCLSVTNFAHWSDQQSYAIDEVFLFPDLHDQQADDFQNLTASPLFTDASLVKFSRRISLFISRYQNRFIAASQ